MPKADHRFEPFDIPKNLIKALEETPFYPLIENLPELEPDGKGVYALYRGDEEKPVYVGKTDKNGNVRKRLCEHAKKLAGRKNIELSEMRFRYLVIGETWLVRACEEYMIEFYDPPWQSSGFGSHIPGSGRPGKVGPNRFDREFPPKA